MRAVHEYQADEGCITSGTPVVNYQQLLMNQVFKSKIFNITNSFSNPAFIKKRMIMMTKERSRALVNLKLLMVLPVIAIVMIAFSSCKGKTKPAESTTTEVAPPPPPPPPAPVKADEKVVVGAPAPTDQIAPPPPPPPPPFTVQNGDTTWHKVDVMPVFPGGEAALIKYIKEHVTYPAAAKEKGIQGKVLVGFVVTTSGAIKDAMVQIHVSPELNAEALRVVNSLPPFEKPGFKNGKPVPVWYAIPINFTLK